MAIRIVHLAEVYIDQTQTMRAMALTGMSEALKKVEKRSKSDIAIAILGESKADDDKANQNQKEVISCPHCLHNILFTIELIDGKFAVKGVAKS